MFDLPVEQRAIAVLAFGLALCIAAAVIGWMRAPRIKHPDPWENHDGDVPYIKPSR